MFLASGIAGRARPRAKPTVTALDLIPFGVKLLAALLAGTLYLGHLLLGGLKFKCLVHADQKPPLINGDEM